MHLEVLFTMISVFTKSFFEGKLIGLNEGS